MGKIIYLAHYYDSCSGRTGSPAGAAVMGYVIDCLNRIGREVTVISPVRQKMGEKSGRQVISIGEQATCIYLPSEQACKKAWLMGRIRRKIIRERNLRKELAKNVCDGDTLIVYHSLGLMKAVNWICRRRKIRLVIQVCEIYADAAQKVSAEARKRELKYLSLADGYIAMSHRLAGKVCGNKPYIVCLGAYRWRNRSREQTKNGIHAVYAGTLDPVKGGAAAAVKMAEFLDESYHIHILGSGSPSEVETVKQLINEVNQKGGAKVTYDGLLQGDAFLDFLQQCHMGLSTQEPGGAFNETSFPSKILSYLCCNLEVVSARIPAVTESEVGDRIHYYEEPTPRSIAEAVRSVVWNSNTDSREILKLLDQNFCSSLERLLSDSVVVCKEDKVAGETHGTDQEKS